jgi:hypothetical protein
LVEYKNKLFVYVLAGLQILNLLVCLYYLLTTGGLLFLIGILISAGLLYLIYSKDEYLPLSTKVWAGIVTVSGVAGLVSAGCAYVHVTIGGNGIGPESFSLAKVLRSIVLMTLGTYYLSKTSKYIVPKRNEVTPQTNVS